MTATREGTAARPAPRLSIAQMLGVMRVEFHRARTQRYPLCCLMVALDGLAAIEQRHGWKGKAAAMGAVYELLKREARAGGHIGMAIQSGDRVMAVFPNTAPERMAALGASLVEAARCLDVRVGDEPCATRLSLGAAHNLLAETNSSFEGLVEQAGRALHLATQGGGDRYVMWRAAESEIESLRSELVAASRTFQAEQQALSDEAADCGGLQRAELVDKIQRIFAGVARSAEIEALEKSVIELAVAELYEERRKAVARQMAEHQRQVDTLERRITKLTTLLGVTEEELARVMSLKQIDPGVASIYRTVQGLRGDDAQAQAKKAMMASIFEQNLSFQKRGAPQPAAVGAA
jgi:GGDEF domain-containing protein